MKIAELRYYLSPLSKEELETLIVELFKKNIKKTGTLSRSDALLCRKRSRIHK